MKDRSYKVYLGTFIPEMGEPVAIVTDNAIGEYDESNEYFLFFSYDDKQIYSLRYTGQISIYRKTLSSEGSEDTEFQPALTHAEYKLRYLINEKYLESKDISFLQFGNELKESTYFHLYSLFVSGVVKKETLEFIGNNTVNRDLREYIKAILNIPELEELDLASR